MNQQNIINYYNKFNEDKRLTRRHGIVEYQTAMKYIHHYLKEFSHPKILDIGAGTGKYAIALANEGYEVHAVELVKHNLMTLQKHSEKVKIYLGNALDLSHFPDNSFEIILLFGPMYHLITEEEKIQALAEAKRILKPNGFLFISYYMNDYAIIKHGFIDGTIQDAMEQHLVDSNFHITPKKEDLYSMVRLEDINRYKRKLKFKRVKILAQDGPSDYIRKTINQMSEEEFRIYLQYHFATCERKELLGASSHILDILKNEKR